jgi:uncharacterized protein
MTPPPAPQPGSIGWFEIGSPDPDRAQAFYSGLFGWSVAAPVASAGFDYRDVTTGPDHPVRGGILGTGGALPAYGVFVVTVTDVAAAVERATALGGTLTAGPVTTGDGLVAAYLADPDGNRFAVFTPPA